MQPTDWSYVDPEPEWHRDSRSRSLTVLIVCGLLLAGLAVVAVVAGGRV